jgi:threonine dehydratase
MTLSISLEHILGAPGRIDPVFLDSPVLQDTALDGRLGCQVVAKVEIHNPVGSFKGRGTDLFAATALAPGEAVVCASAGNFGQGLARAAARRGHTCTVFAAETANPLKVEAMRRFGADVRLVGADFEEAKDAASSHAAEHGMRFVADGSEAAIAEGAGTIGLELCRSERFDMILVQLGNGALLAGVGALLRELVPQTRIIGIVAENAPAMQLSMAAGHPIQTGAVNTIADGIAVRTPVAGIIELLSQCCDEVVAVGETSMLQAMRLVHRDLGLVLEPSGAAGIAYLLANPERFRGQRVATILSGGNISNALRAQL